MNPIANAITITITITITNPNPIANPGVPRIPARRLQTGGIRVPVRPSAGERRQARRRLDNGLHGRREGQVRTRPLPLLPSPLHLQAQLKAAQTRATAVAAAAAVWLYTIYFSILFEPSLCVCVRSTLAQYFWFPWFPFVFFVLPKYLMISLIFRLSAKVILSFEHVCNGADFTNWFLSYTK